MAALPSPLIARTLAWAGLALLLGGCVTQPGPPPPVVDRTSGVVTPASPAPATGLPPGQPLGTQEPPEPGRPEFHEVQVGDTLYGIAWRYGVDYRTIAQANAIDPPYRIVVGQRLRLGGPPQPGLSPGIVQAPGVQTQTGPMYEPDPPASRGFEFVPDSPMESEDRWQDLPPPGPAPQEPQALPQTAEAPPQPMPIEPPTESRPMPMPIEPPPESRPIPMPIEPPPEPAVAVSGVDAPGVTQPRPVVVPEQPATQPLPAPVPETPVAVVPVQPAPSAPAPATPPAPSPVTAGWRWPTSGAVQKGFGNGNRGIDFRLDANEPVLAAGGGEVVYAGNGLGGFRYLVIVKHDQRFLSAYSLNRAIAVQEGQQIQSGGVIAERDASGGAAGTLRFEIRRDGQPVDPAGIIGR